MILFAASTILQAITLSLTKSFNPDECGLIGGLRHNLRVFVPNIILTFWSICMIVNYYTVKRGVQARLDNGHGRNFTKFMDQGQLYLGLFFNCCMHVLLNNVTMQYNLKKWCVGEDYEHAIANLNEHHEFRSHFHYVLTLLSMMCYSQSFQLFSTLMQIYE